MIANINFGDEEQSFNISTVDPERVDLWVHEFTEMSIALDCMKKNNVDWRRDTISIKGTYAEATMPHLMASLHTFSLFRGKEITPDELWSMIVGAEK